MAKEIYVEGNYIITVDEDEKLYFPLGYSVYERAAGNITIQNTLKDESKGIAEDDVPNFSDAKGGGSPYSVATLETLYLENTGFKAAGGGSSASLYTADGTITDAYRIVTLSGDTAGEGVIFSRNNGNPIFAIAGDGTMQTTSATKRVLSGAGTHKTIMGGALSTDVKAWRNSADTEDILSIHGNDFVSIHEKLNINTAHTGTGGALNVHAGTTNDYVQSWFNPSNMRVMDVRTASGGSQVQMRDSTGSIALTLSGQSSNVITIVDGRNISTGNTTGTKLPSAAVSKLGFWGTTPVVQQVLATGTGATVDDVIGMLQTIGICKQS